MTLNENIFLVEGASGNSCIYDLRNKFAKIYHINAEGTNYIHGILDHVIHECDMINDLIKDSVFVPDNHSFSNRKECPIPEMDFAWIEITIACPFTCRHCYNNSNTINNGAFMAKSDFELTCKRLKTFGVNSIQIIGGEPTAHPFFLELLATATEYFNNIEVFTNGYFLSDKVLSFGKKYGIHFAMSYYSDIEDEYEKVTGIKGSYNKLLHSIERMESLGIPYRLECVLMDGIKFTNNLYDVINTEPDMPRLTGAASHHLYNKEMYDKKCIKKKSFSKRILSSDIIQNMTWHKCFAKKIYITHDLECYPCVMERAISYGNIRNNEICEIINTDLCKLNKDKISGCCDCEYRYACFDCRPDRDGKELTAKPWYCLYDEKKGVWKESY